MPTQTRRYRARATGYVESHPVKPHPYFHWRLISGSAQVSLKHLVWFPRTLCTLRLFYMCCLHLSHFNTKIGLADLAEVGHRAGFVQQFLLLTTFGRRTFNLT